MEQRWWTLYWDLQEEPRKSNIRGANVDSISSPYDIPAGLGSYVDREHNVLVILLKYLSEEPLRELKHGDLVFMLGRNSNRLMRLQVKTDKIRPRGDQSSELTRALFTHVVEEGIRDLQSKIGAPSALHNYEIAKDVILQKSSEIVASLQQ